MFFSFRVHGVVAVRAFDYSCHSHTQILFTIGEFFFYGSSRPIYKSRLLADIAEVSKSISDKTALLSESSLDEYKDIPLKLKKHEVCLTHGHMNEMK